MQHTAKAVLAVGLRQKALRQRFLIATTASRVFQQPIRVHSCLFAVKKRIESVIIRVIRGGKGSYFTESAILV
jgi:hypothetical protein